MVNQLLITIVVILFGWAFFHAGPGMANDLTTLCGAAIGAITATAIQASVVIGAAWLWFRGALHGSWDLILSVWEFYSVWKDYSFLQAFWFHRYFVLNEEAEVVDRTTSIRLSSEFDDFVEQVKSTVEECDGCDLTDAEALHFIEGNLILRRMHANLQEEDYFNGHHPIA